jgi:CRISPR-associated protein Cmr3
MDRAALDSRAYIRGQDGTSSIDGLNLFDEIGNPRSGGVGKLRLSGPFPEKEGAVLFPLPLDVVRAPGGYAFLRPGEPRRCDLGTVRLPSAGSAHVVALSRQWVAAGTMGRLLEEHLPGPIDVVPEQIPEGVFRKGPKEATESLYVVEPRVGLARDNASRTAREGHLYAIGSLRLKEQITFALGVGGIDDRLNPVAGDVMRFGGEGKLVRVSCGEAWSLPHCPELLALPNGRLRFRLFLTAPARFGGWCPPGFHETGVDGETRWKGHLLGAPDVEFEIVSACVGKSQRLGGWDLAQSAPKPLQACVPAGSVYFCETNASPAQVARLHGKSFGEGAEIGFGLMFVGRWT